MTFGTRTVAPAILSLLSLVASNVRGQTVATQGDSKNNPGGYEEFRSPMVLKTALPLAPRVRWDDSREWWVMSTEWLGRFRCEKISMPFLQTRQQSRTGKKVELTLRTSLNNPDQNYDKKVRVLFELLNGDTVSGTLRIEDFKLKEGASKGKTVKGLFAEQILTAEPPPTVRVTITTWDY